MRRLLLALALLACGRSDDGPDGGDGGGGEGGQPSSAQLYSADYGTVVLEIDYETGAEPFTGPVTGFGDTWSIFVNNADRLFMGSTKIVEVPTTLEEMESIGDLTDEDHSVEEILALAEDHRNQVSRAPTATFYVVFLDGWFFDAGERKTSVLGVSIGGTGVIAMFKPVIETAGGILESSTRFAEQAILVHEFGHAVGLVGNGIPLASDHQDPAHGAHCLNDRCVMYFAYEGAADLAMFVRDYVTQADVILFAPDCLADVDAIIAGG